jgi:hypothetical protein
VEVVVVASRQPWDDDLKAQAKALYLADGAQLAADVTGIPVRTIRRWAVADRWGRPPGPDSGHVADQGDTQDAPDPAREGGPAKRDGGSFGSFSGMPGMELEQDLALARQVYRTEVERFLAGGGRAGGVRDASIALGVLLDKMGKHGSGQAGGGEFTWADLHARAEAAGPRILEMATFLATRARAAGNGHG